MIRRIILLSDMLHQLVGEAWETLKPTSSDKLKHIAHYELTRNHTSVWFRVRSWNIMSLLSHKSKYPPEGAL